MSSSQTRTLVIYLIAVVGAASAGVPRRRRQTERR
jgi:hypothetical protein